MWLAFTLYVRTHCAHACVLRWCLPSVPAQVWHDAKLRRAFSKKHTAPLWEHDQSGGGDGSGSLSAPTTSSPDAMGFSPRSAYGARLISGGRSNQQQHQQHSLPLPRGGAPPVKHGRRASGSGPLPLPNPPGAGGFSSAEDATLPGVAGDVRAALSAGLRQMNRVMARQMERLVDALALHEANRQQQLRQQQRQQEQLAVAQRRVVDFGASPTSHGSLGGGSGGGGSAAAPPPPALQVYVATTHRCSGCCSLVVRSCESRQVCASYVCCNMFVRRRRRRLARG